MLGGDQKVTMYLHLVLRLLSQQKTQSALEGNALLRVLIIRRKTGCKEERKLG